jgi:predicted peptidase
MKRLILTIATALICCYIFAQESYQAAEFTSADTKITLKYRYLTPHAEKPGKKYPLVIFLHGSGERGNDNEAQLLHGGQMFLNPVYREKYPAYVLFPQCPQEFSGAYERGKLETLDPHYMPVNPPLQPIMQTVMELINSYIDMPSVDNRRVYIIGLSMGGMATFDLACRFPGTFAAAIPICGSVNPQRLVNAGKVHFRIFHGDADKSVPVEGSRGAYKALKAIGADVEYIEFAGCTHNSWNPAFNYPDFMKWLFKQKKSPSASSPARQ